MATRAYKVAVAVAEKMFASKRSVSFRYGTQSHRLFAQVSSSFPLELLSSTVPPLQERFTSTIPHQTDHRSFPHGHTEANQHRGRHYRKHHTLPTPNQFSLTAVSHSLRQDQYHPSHQDRNASLHEQSFPVHISRFPACETR